MNETSGCDLPYFKEDGNIFTVFYGYSKYTPLHIQAGIQKIFPGGGGPTLSKKKPITPEN